MDTGFVMAPNHSLKLATLVMVCSGLGAAESSAYFSSDNLFTSPDYHSTNDVTFSMGKGLGTGKVSIQDFHVNEADRIELTRAPAGVTHEYHFAMTSSWSVDGSPPVTLEGRFGRCICKATWAGVGSDGADLFDTEMLAMQVELTDPSGGASFLLRESPTLASTGQTTVKPTVKKTAPRPFTSGSSGFEVNSFFDVFTELSIDGGQNWIPSDASSHLQGTPEPASIAAMGVGMAALLRRRNKKA